MRKNRPAFFDAASPFAICFSANSFVGVSDSHRFVRVRTEKLISKRCAMADLTPAQIQDERERIRTALASRATGRCPRCSNTDFTLLDGFIILPLSPRSNRAVLGGKTLSCAVTACRTCGYIAMHSLTHLGVMPAGAAH
jgi:hypothetical protein